MSDVLTFEVTQEDIDRAGAARDTNNEYDRCSQCMVAEAAARHLGEPVYCGFGSFFTIQANNDISMCPKDTYEFVNIGLVMQNIIKFDQGISPEPFTVEYRKHERD